ncbi:MAG: 3-methyl-2-oxobutanoate hydroxymethyltransferase [Acidobacteria bacterium]|nr:3-methyl-2-oxobutanoate hydroxymethyltransferase [Acidobacteriota bacterium]
MNPLTGNSCPKVTIPSIQEKKQRREAITCLTAYDYATARLVDEAGIDMVLVGDSLAMVVLGHDTTLPVTMDEMLHHTRAARRAVRRALLVADMPYASYHVSMEEAIRNAARFVKEAGAEAVKVEGGEKRAVLVERLLEAEIPVVGHIGLTPQSVHRFGGFKVQGKSLAAIEQLMRDAAALEGSGAFALVLEGIPREVAAMVTRHVGIPTIGIGAGPDCDGQVLVLHDLLGLGFQPPAKFVRQYANLRGIIGAAVANFRGDVEARTFPAESESYHLPPETVHELQDLAARGSVR